MKYKDKIAWLGCGEFPMQGAINVDCRQLPGVDVVADVRKLPFADRELRGIGSRNLIEHFARNEIKPMLKDWVRCLKKDGFLSIETVDCGELMDRWKEIPEENLLDGLLGAQTYDENFHKMIFTQKTLEKFLSDAGLEVVKCDRWDHRQIPRMRILAVKDDSVEMQMMNEDLYGNKVK